MSEFVLSEFHFTADEDEKTRPHTHTADGVLVWWEKLCSTKDSWITVFIVSFLMCPLSRPVGLCRSHLHGYRVFQIWPIGSTISQVATGRTEQKRDLQQRAADLSEKDFIWTTSERERVNHFCYVSFPFDTELNCCVSVLGDAVVQRLRLGSAGTDGDHTDRKPTHRWTVVSFLSWHPLRLLGVYFKRRRAAESTGTLNQRLLLQWGHSAWMFFPSKQWQIHLRNRLTRTPLSQCPQLKQSLLYIYCPTFSLPSRLASNSEVRISGQHYESLWNDENHTKSKGMEEHWWSSISVTPQ